MARVPLLDVEDSPALKDLADRIRAARRGRVINVYRLLLHSPPLAETWFDHNNAVRWDTGLDGRLREMVIIRIGYLARARYVVGQHVPKLALAEGLSLAECDALKEWRGFEPVQPARPRRARLCRCHDARYRSPRRGVRAAQGIFR